MLLLYLDFCMCPSPQCFLLSSVFPYLLPGNDRNTHQQNFLISLLLAKEVAFCVVWSPCSPAGAVC